MTDVRIIDAPAFTAAGRKTWISGQDNAQFGAFWASAHQSGLVERLKALSKPAAQSVTGSSIFGISCVEKDPNNRAFDFFIAAETDEAQEGLEQYTVPACTWAVFTGEGELPMSLVNAEMYAFMQWLPSSGYRHAFAPELEVYPARDGSIVEFWLPIEK